MTVRVFQPSPYQQAIFDFVPISAAVLQAFEGRHGVRLPEA